MPGSGYLDTPWPAEDGGAARLQVPNGVVGLGLRPGERLLATAVTRVMSTMTVLGAPGEVYLLTHSALRARWGRPTSCRVSRIDPITLAPAAMSPRLPGGPMWPGGMAVHANGDLYVVYGRWAHRLDRNCGVFDWDGQTLVRDMGWRFDYATGTAQTYGWDVVLGLSNAWFMDNGKHRYLRSMIGRGVSQTANRLIRVNLSDCTDVETAEVSGIPGGTITNPPLVDEGRRIVVGYDSANRVLRAWLFDGELRHLWRKDAFGAASHMICLPDSGEIVTNDFGRGGEHVVVLDIETGAEKGRARIGGFTQGVVFPSPGWSRDIYWSAMSRFGRVFVG